MASLQRAATNPLARVAGSPYAASRGAPSGGVTPNPLWYQPPPAPPPDTGAENRRNAENRAGTAEADARARAANAPAPQPTGYGVPSSVPRGTSVQGQPASPAPTFDPNRNYAQEEIQRQSDEFAAMLARQRADDARRAAELRRPQEEEQARQAEFQRQRTIQLQRDEAEQAAKAEMERRSMEAFQMSRARENQQREADALSTRERDRMSSEAAIQSQNADRQRQTDEAQAHRTALTRTPETGAVNRTEGTLDAGATRDDLSAMIDMARSKGLLSPASSSSSSSAMTSLTNAAAPAPVAPRVAYSDGGAASRAAFSTAKDRVGQLGRGAMNSLQRAISGRGLSGSSIEGREMGGIVEGSLGELSNTIRDQAGYDAARGDAVSDRNYSGDITQRGQDIAAQQEAARLALAQRSQSQSETNSGFSNLGGLMSLIRRGRPAY